MDIQSHNLLACRPCQKTFTTRKALLRHQRENKNHQHEGSDQYLCLPCDKVFARNSDLLRHNREQHGDGKMPCKLCGKPVRPNAPHRKCTTAKRSRDRCANSSSLNDQTGDSISTINAQAGVHHSDSEALAENLGQRDLSEPLALDFRLGEHLQNFEVRPLNRTIPCGLCKATFSAKSINKLVAHLNAHFDSFRSARHACDICEIVFQHKSDLEKHLASAAQRDCGFIFSHKSACTGHHPRVRSTQTLGGVLDDDDRFEFCFRVREWEFVQQVAFGRCLSDIQAAAVTYRRAKSAFCSSTSIYYHPLRIFSTPGRFARDGAAPGLGLLQHQENALQSKRLRADHASDEVLEVELLRAAMSGSTALVDAWISFGLDVNFADAAGLTALHYGVRAQCIDVLELLLAHGADLNAVDGFGMTPLSYACCSGGLELMKRLLSHQAVASDEDVLRAITYDNTTIFAVLVEAIAAQSQGSMPTKHDVTSLADYCVRMSSPRCVGSLDSLRWNDASNSGIVNPLFYLPVRFAILAVVRAGQKLATRDLDIMIKAALCQMYTDLFEKSSELVFELFDHLEGRGPTGLFEDDACGYSAMPFLDKQFILTKSLVSKAIGINQTLRVAIRTGNVDMVEFILDKSEPAKRTYSFCWQDLDRLELSLAERFCHCDGSSTACELCAMPQTDKWKAACKIRGLLFAKHGIDRKTQFLQDDDRAVWRRRNGEWILESVDTSSTLTIFNMPTPGCPVRLYERVEHDS